MHEAREALRRHFGYAEFRPGQVDVVQSVLAGHDTLGVLPTGGGKSLCYQVPALVLPGVTVVISPLISLMKDQVDRLASIGVPATFLNSTLDQEESRSRLAALRRGAVKLLYVAPERFASDELLRSLAVARLQLLAVDEAHCVSEWGHEFRPSFRRIALGSARFPGLQTMALTATATPAVRRDIAEQLRLRTPRVIVGGFDRANLSYAVVPCRDDDAKRAHLVRLVGEERGLGVVYASTRADVVRVTRMLRTARIPAAAYHGGLPARVRQDAQEAFMAERVRVIVATNAFGMGIDKPNVRFVLHYAMPGTLEAYYQEAGRAGRDGLPGRCTLLHAREDRQTHEWFIQATFPEAAVVRRVYAALQTLNDHGRVPGDVAPVARAAGLLPTQAGAAMRWLEQKGALVRGDPSRAAMHVRVMALPARIRAELPEQSEPRRVLRALWRMGGERVHERITLSPSTLGIPPHRARSVLTFLRDRQFLQFDADADALHLKAPGAPLAALGLDLGAIARRRGSELAKLDCMLRYASTSECRRWLVLAYFGERRSSGRCGGCDNCLRS